MNQFIGLSVLLGGLFGIATMLLWRLPWPRREFLRTFFEGLIVGGDLAVTLWLNRHFSQHSYELIATTLACSHFAFVCFWCVTSRGPSPLRIGLFALVVAIMFGLFLIPTRYLLPHDGNEGAWIAVGGLSQRLIVTCVAAWIAGIACRLRGWRLESAGASSHQRDQQSVDAKQVVPTLVGLALAVPVIIAAHWFVESNWTNTFNRDFSIAALSCLYGGLMLSVLSVTACRFSQKWMSAVVAVLMVSWLLYALENRRYDSFQALEYGTGEWAQYTRWLILGTLWWWLVWKHLEGAGFSLRKTDESLAKRPKLKHVMIATALMAALFASVKSRYFDQFEALIRREGVSAEPAYGAIKALTFSHNGIPERIVTHLGRLKELRSISFQSCIIESDVMKEVLAVNGLTALSFVECDISAVGLAGIESIKGLESIELIETPATFKDFRLLSQLINLKRIALSDAANASELQSLPNIEHLDLSRCTSLDPALLLLLDLRNVRRIDFPSWPKDAAFRAVPSPAQFPKLVELKLELSTVTPSMVEKIQKFPSLERLELVGCQGGLEFLQPLVIKQLSLRNCSLSAADLDQLAKLDKPKSLKLFGVVSIQTIQQDLERLIILAKHYETVDIDLSPEDVSALPATAMTATLASGDEFVFRRSDQLKIRTGYVCRLPEVEITFDGLLDLLRIGHVEFAGTTVKDGDRDMSGEVSRRMFGSEFAFQGLTTKELSRLLAAAPHLSELDLDLSAPQLAIDDWRLLTDSTMGNLSLRWNETPDNLEQILDQFLKTNIFLHIYLEDDKMDDSTRNRILETFSGRLLFLDSSGELWTKSKSSL